MAGNIFGSHSRGINYHPLATVIHADIFESNTLVLREFCVNYATTERISFCASLASKFNLFHKDVPNKMKPTSNGEWVVKINSKIFYIR